jgi:hypothetical protein
MHNLGNVLVAEILMPRFYFNLASKDTAIPDDSGKELDTLNDAYEHARKLICKILFYVGHDDAEAWKVVILNNHHGTQMIIDSLFPMRLALNAEGKSNFETSEDNKQDRMARNLREVIAAVSAERRAKVAAAYRQKLIALKKKRQLEEAKRVMGLDSNLIAIAVIIAALPIIAVLGWMLTVLAVGDGAH